MRRFLLFLICFVLLIFLVGSTIPIVSIVSPGHGTVYVNTNNITFVCNSTSNSYIKNISLYHNLNGSYILNQTIYLGELISGNGTVLLMHFNNNSGLENNSWVYDFSGNGNNGSVSGAQFNSSKGKFLGAFVFNNTLGDIITIRDSDSLDLTTSGAIEFWINLSNAQISSTKQIVIKGDSVYDGDTFAVSLDAFRQLILNIDGEEYSSQTGLSTYTFNHVVVQWDNSFWSLYINGNLDLIEPISHTLSANDKTLKIGGGLDGVIDELAIYNRTLTSSEIFNHSNRTISNYTSQNFTINSIPDGSYTWNCFSYNNDSEGNSSLNYSLHIDTSSGPTTNSINFSPSSLDNIDPGITINVTANVTDVSNVSKVIFQWRENGNFNNVTMVFNSSTGMYENVSFNIDADGGIYYYRTWSNDSNGFSVFSSTQNVTADFDYTWDASPNDLGTASGFLSSIDDVGILTINNTGDDGLNFSFSDNWPLATYYNGSEIFSFLLDEGTSTIVNVSARFSDSDNEIGMIINVSASHPTKNPSPAYENVSATVNSYSGGPFLIVTILNESVSTNQSETINLSSKVKNTGNETSTGTWLNWTLPSGWTNSSGNSTYYIGNLTSGSTSFNNLTITISALDATSGIIVLYSNASSSENKTGNDSTSISLSCSNTDNICGLSCTFQNDVDCPDQTVVNSGSSSGGGGSNLPEVIVFEKTIEVLRGGNLSFPIEIENSFANHTLNNLTLYLEGFLSQYVITFPKEIEEIKFSEIKNFTVNITSPSYLESNEFILNATITGLKVNGDSIINYIEKQHIKLIIQEISKEEVNILIDEAENSILSMEESHFNVEKLNILLNQSKEKLKLNKNSEARDLAREIINQKDKAFRVHELIIKMGEILENPRKFKSITGNAISLNHAIEGVHSVEDVLNLAIAAFDRGDYNLSEERIESAKSLLLLGVKGSFFLFLILYWKILILSIIIFSTVGVMGVRRYEKTNISKKIYNLNREEENINDLINKNQDNFFSGKISRGNYVGKEKNYWKQIAKIHKLRINLRNKRIKILKSREISTEIENEILEIESKIKGIQESYYKKQTTPKKEYDSKFKILNERLAELEENKVTLHLMGRENEINHKKIMGGNKNYLAKTNLFIDKLKHKIIQKLTIWKKFRKDEKGIMFIDNSFIKFLRRELDGKDLNGRWINIKIKKEGKNEG